MVDLLNWFLTRSVLMIGNTVCFKKTHPIPEDRTLIFVANHQSLFDIPPLIWFLRKYHPKFVAKQELATGIPSVSFNLRYGGAALINRKNRRQALATLERFGQRIHNNKWSAIIFPEGTRGASGIARKFKLDGLKSIVKKNPEACIVPISINNSWKVFKYGTFPFGMFHKITIETHKPLDLKDADLQLVFSDMETIIKAHIHRP